jgi:hypothetical protein
MGTKMWIQRQARQEECEVSEGGWDSSNNKQKAERSNNKEKGETRKKIDVEGIRTLARLPGTA